MDLPPVGGRVVVPLGSRWVTGIVVEHEEASAGAAIAGIKPVREALDRTAFLPADVVSLARWTAEYYAGGVGEAITAVLPPKTRGERADAHKSRRVVTLTPEGAAGLADPTARLTARQRDLLGIVAGVPDGAATAELASRGFSPDVVSRMVRDGLLAVSRQNVDRDPFQQAKGRAGFFGPDGGSEAASPTPFSKSLTEEQQAALTRLTALVETGTFRVALLHGVTGSGKTEIYLRLSSAVKERGRSVLMLVPEIALTPAMAGEFRQVFGERVAVQHSGLSDGERHDQWQRIRRGDVDIVVGTRSAVFAPVERIGLIIVDEEHDASYKQDESPRYNGRDVAIVRGQRAGALVLLGSATPSMESYHHALGGKYERVVLTRRVLDRPLPAVRVVDMREEYAAAGPDVVLSRPLAAALVAQVERGEQSLVLLNRRGFATSVFCRQCAGTIDCPNCSVSLVVHGEGVARRARCHYCNYAARVPATCPACAAPYLDQAGFGTERVEAEVKRACPARVSRESTGTPFGDAAPSLICSRASATARLTCWSGRR